MRTFDNRQSNTGSLMDLTRRSLARQQELIDTAVAHLSRSRQVLDQVSRRLQSRSRTA